MMLDGSGVCTPAEILPWAARIFTDKLALISAGRAFSYTDLERQSAAMASALRQRGITEGDVVSICGQNSWQWVVAYHGALRAGAVVNPLNVMLSGPELAYALNDCHARALFAAAAPTPAAAVAEQVPTLQIVAEFGDASPHGAVGFAALLQEAVTPAPTVRPADPRELCAIAYTSGTTGHPKGAMQSHQSILLNCALTASMHGRNDRDIVVSALPAAHVYGNVVINSTFLTGGTVVLMERFNPAEALQLIAAEHATMFEGVPMMYGLMISDPLFEHADLTSLRKSTVGGQAMSPELARQWEKRSGARLLELWGMTELSGLGATHSLHAPAVLGSVGMPLPGMEMKILDMGDSDCEAAVGERGELVVRGPLVMMGYFGNPAGTAEVLDEEGWLRTGDVAFRDHDGYYYVVDRSKDMILTGGYNVYPAELERVIGEHPGVAMVGVGKRGDAVRGEIAVAYIVARDGAQLNEQDIVDFCATRLAAYKRPRAVVFVEQLPLTGSGKLLRRRLSALDPIQACLSAGTAT
ncbi:MAG TPA: AMP-binding protein [Mycobacterium sp.]|nr:AMP-binding protein [Mycobacterium sp.]